MNATFHAHDIVGWCYTHANYRQKSRILGYMFLSYDFWVSGSIIWIIVIVAYILCVNIYVCATGGRHKVSEHKYHS